MAGPMRRQAPGSSSRAAGVRSSALGRPPIAELERVSLSSSVTDDDGREVPAGSTGPVVGVYRGGAAYEVEFVEPFHTVATVLPDAIHR